MALRWGGGGSGGGGGGGGGGQGNIQWQDDGTDTGAPGQATTVNVTGSATVSVTGSTATIDVTGGGGGPTLIETNTTLTVGTGGTYATFAAALAYLQTVVIADGVTITLQFVGTTSTEQIILNGWKSGLIITSTGAVTVTPTSWENVSPAFPFPAMIMATGCSNVTVEGTWAAEGYAIFVANTQSDITINNAAVTGDWIETLYQQTGITLISGGSHVNLLAENQAISGSIWVNGATFTGGVVSGGANVTVSGCTITGAAICNGGTLTLTGNTFTNASNTIMLQSTATGGIIQSSGNTFNLTGGSGTYIDASGTGSIQSAGDTFYLGSGVTLAIATSSGHVQISQVTTDGTGPATARFSAMGGGLIQSDGSATTANWGADTIGSDSLLIGT